MTNYTSGMSRRGFLKGLAGYGTATGLATLSNTGCGWPKEGPDIASPLTVRLLKAPLGKKSGNYFIPGSPDKSIFDAYQQELVKGPFQRVYTRGELRRDLFSIQTNKPRVHFNFDVERLFGAMNPRWSPGDIAYVIDVDGNNRIGDVEGMDGGVLDFTLIRDSADRMVLKEATHVTEIGERRLVYHEMGSPCDPKGRMVLEIIR